MKGKSNPNNKETAEPLPEIALPEQIEKRAYHLWLTSGGRHGDDLCHWLQAEAEVLKASKRDQEERSSVGKTSTTPKPRSSPAPNEAVPKK